MSRESDDARAKLEAEHPVVKNAALKGVGCGVAAFGALALATFIVWSLSPLAPIGVAYSAVGAIPWLIGAGVVVLIVRTITRRR